MNPALGHQRDLMRHNGLNYSFEDVDREFQAIVAQLTDEELRTYLKESLFMSFNRFENDRLMQIVRKANRADEDESPLV